MQLQITDMAGSGLGRDAKYLKTHKTLTSYAEWDAAVKSCMTNMRARVEGNERQSDALVKDVLDFIKVSK